MKRSVGQSILSLLAFTVLIVGGINSCKSTGTKKKAAKKNANACLQSTPSGSIQASAPVSGKAMQLTDLDLSLNTSNYGSSSALTQIKIDPLNLGARAGIKGEAPPFYIMYRVCEASDTSCQQKGDWHRDFSFSSARMADLPLGDLKISVKTCVDDLALVESDAASTLNNDCTKDTPCYCGSPIDRSFNNTKDPAKQDSSLRTTAGDLRNSRDSLFSIAKDYHRDAASYVKRCTMDKDDPAQTAWFQYAENIANLSSSEIAWITQSYGSDMQQFLKLLQQQSASSGLNLADTATQNCTGSKEAVATPSPSAEPTNDVGSIAVNQPAAEASLPPQAASTSDATTSTNATQDTQRSTASKAASIAVIGVGSVIALAGGVMMGGFGLRKYTSYRLEDVFEFSSRYLKGDSRLGKFFTRIGTLSYLTDEINGSVRDMNKALVENDWDAFEKARTRLEGAADKLDTATKNRLSAKTMEEDFPELKSAYNRITEIQWEYDKFEPGRNPQEIRVKDRGLVLGADGTGVVKGELAGANRKLFAGGLLTKSEAAVMHQVAGLHDRMKTNLFQKKWPEFDQAYNDYKLMVDALPEGFREKADLIEWTKIREGKLAPQVHARIDNLDIIWAPASKSYTLGDPERQLYADDAAQKKWFNPTVPDPVVTETFKDVHPTEFKTADSSASLKGLLPGLGVTVLGGLVATLGAVSMSLADEVDCGDFNSAVANREGQLSKVLEKIRADEHTIDTRTLQLLTGP